MTQPHIPSFGNDFNHDYNVSFTPEEKENGEVYYNFGRCAYFESEGPGISVFYKDENGNIFHTYSSCARGLGMLIGAYHLLDLVPKGRDETDLPWTMARGCAITTNMTTNRISVGGHHAWGLIRYKKKSNDLIRNGDYRMPPFTMQIPDPFYIKFHG